MRRTGLALGALAAGAFAIGTTEFVIVGVLPEVGRSFHVTVAAAGLLVSGYALGVVIGAPLVTMAVVRLPRKKVLLGLLMLFVAGNLVCASAPGYPVMMAGRVIASLCHGAFFGVGSIVAAGLVAPARRARAIAAMFSGLTFASVAGVPLGTLLGQDFGWRSTFFAVAGLGAAGMAAIAAWVPAVAVGPGAGVRAELAAFRRGQVWLALAMTALGFGAVYAPFTYVVPMMTSVAGFAPSSVIWLLVLFGAGFAVGNAIGARAADWRLMGSLTVLLVLLTGVLALFSRTARSEVPAALTLFVLGAVAYATVPGFTSRVISSSGGTASNTVASSAAVAAFNLGNAAGAYLGGRVIAAGFGLTSPSVVGAAMAAAAVLVALTSALVQRRARLRPCLLTADVPQPSVHAPATAMPRLSSGRELTGGKGQPGDEVAVVVIAGPEGAADPHYSRVLTGASRAAAQLGISVSLHFATAESLPGLAPFSGDRRYAGAILVNVGQDAAIALAGHRLPVVSLGASAPGLPCLVPENAAGAASAVEHLLAHGRRRIVTIAGPPGNPCARERLAGYRRAVLAAGLPAAQLSADFTRAGAADAARRLLESHPDLDAIFVASDLMATAVLGVLAERGRRVPDDVAVVGFDNSQLARTTAPALTTVHQPVERIAARAFHTLLQPEAERPPRQQLPTRLVVRASSVA